MTDRLLTYAKRMRRTPIDAEALLWRRLRAHRFADFKFKRQQPLGPFIVDYVCFARMLVIEVDGGQHGEAQSYDATRTAWLESLIPLPLWERDSPEGAGRGEPLLRFRGRSRTPFAYLHV